MADLEALPTELLLNVTSYLQPSSHLSLRLASKNLFQRLPSTSSCDSKRFSSPCEHQAITRNITERGLLGRNQRRCILCGGVQATDFFIGSTPICKWHEGWFLYRCIPGGILPAIRIELEKERAKGNTEEPKWIAIKRVYCAHERNILAWHVGECCCGCQSCGWFEVTCYIRLDQPEEGEEVVSFTSPPAAKEDRIDKTMSLRSQWRIRTPGPWIHAEDDKR